MKYLKIIVLFLPLALFSQTINLSTEYSNQEFQNGTRAFHNTEYERAITFFIKALGYNDGNNLARYFLGESYRKAGYENNALFIWNNLLSLGYNEKYLKNKLAYIYNKKGLLNEVNLNKKYVLREDIKGYYKNTSNLIFMKPAQIAVDKNNHYYIASYLTNMVVEFDANFNVIRNHFPLTGKIAKPFGVAIDDEGIIYISDFEQNEIVKLDRTGFIKGKIGFKGIGDGALLGPEYLLIDDESNLYAVDSGNKRINKYKTNGEFLFSFGNEDTDNKLMKPAGLFFHNDNIYICDRTRNEVLIYDKSGNFLSSFGSDKLYKPYQITLDNFNRFLILCETELWIYDFENNLWYQEESFGSRLERGISIVKDKEENLLITDFNNSRLLVLSPERDRYTNLNVNIERIFSLNFPETHIALTVEKENLSDPSNIALSNISIYENGRAVPFFGKAFTEQKNKKSDIMIIFDNNIQMEKYKNDFKTIINSWFKDISSTTNIALTAINSADAVLLNDFSSTRLSLMESVSKSKTFQETDKGQGIKFGIYNMLRRFSKKAVILATNGEETGNDFNKFDIENLISLAQNNNVPVYVVSFGDGALSEIYRYISKKTGGDYYRVYKRGDIGELVKKIEKQKDKEIILSYTSKTLSRFGEEPISVTVEVDYGGMKGVAKTIYFPSNKKPFYKN